jgi:hypothetical protein
VHGHFFSTLLATSRRRFVLAGLAYAFLAVAWARPSSLSPADTVPDAGDPLHLGWVMAWDAHALLHQPLAFFDSNSFYPYPHSLAFADHLLPEALAVAPVQWLTGNSVLASNVALLLALLLSALAMCALVSQATGSWPAGFLAGLAYAFNSFTLHELPRLHVLNLQWWPLAILFLLRFAREGRGKDAALFAVMLGLQGLSGTYYLAYSALVAPLWLAAAYLGSRSWPNRGELAKLCAALFAVAVPCAVFLNPYRRLLQDLGFEKGWAGGADLLSYLDPPAHNWLWGWLDLGTRPELPHFLGFAGGMLVLAGILLVLLRRAEPSARGFGLVALVSFGLGVALSLGPLIHVGGVLWCGGPYDLVYWHVPFAKAMASPERVGVLAVLGGAMLLGQAVAALLASLQDASRVAVAVALSVLLPLEHWAAPRPATAIPTGTSVPRVERWLAEQPSEPMVDLPLYPERAKKLWAMYLQLSTYHWHPVPIGRTSFYPPAHDFLAWCLRGFPDAVSLAALDRFGVRVLVVHPWSWPPLERDPGLLALAASPRLELVRSFDDRPPAQYAELGLGDERVYRLLPAEPLPAPCAPAGELPRAGWSLRSTGVNREDRLRDGDPRTAWMTERPQRPGDQLEVTLREPESLAAASLGLTYPFDEFPRNLMLSGRAEGEDSWHRLPFADGPAERVSTLTQLLERPRDAALVLRFAPQRLERIRFALGSRDADPAWPRWAVSELRLYRECR